MLVLHTAYDEPLPPDLYAHYRAQLSEAQQRKLDRFRRWEDRQASLLGKMLLVEALAPQGFNHTVLEQLAYGASGKPYVPGANVDFNITHGGGVVACVVSEEGPVGLDVERIAPLEYHYYQEQFSTRERTLIETPQGPDWRCFFDFWTRKEALIKAEGSGLQVNLEGLDIAYDDTVAFGEYRWRLYPISLGQAHTCHLASLASQDHEIITKNVPQKVGL